MSNVAKLKKRALDYEQKKQFDKALDAYMQVLGALDDHVDEGDVALFNRVGDLLLRQGNVSAAVDHYERAVDLYTEGGFHNNAIALCSKILRNAPGRNSVYYKLGRISAKKGFTSDAKSNFLEYADRMQRIGHVEEAFRALKEFADLCPDQDDIRLMLADQLVRGDRKAEAIEQLQLLYEKFQAEGRTQEARATLERMTAIDPSHQPTTGVSRPTPKANDLIFLDVGFDMPGTPSRPVTGSVPVVPTADSVRVAPPAAEELPPDTAGQSLPMIDVGESDALEIAPVDGLSSGAMFDAGADPTASGAHEVVGQMNPELITGFEGTSLGVIDDVADAVAPLADVEQSNPLSSDHDPVDLSLDTEYTAAPEANVAGAAMDAPQGDGDDSLSLLDISLDIIDDGTPDSSDGLTLIFPDGDSVAEWNGGAPSGYEAAAADAPETAGTDVGAVDTFSTELPDDGELVATPEDELKLEPLLQLPELEPVDGSVDSLGQERDLPLISLGDEGMTMLSSLDGGDALAEDEVPASASKLRFLDVGDNTELPPISQPQEPARAATQPTLADLRTIAELNPDDWEARRRLAEALLEAGDRHGGLAELEAAMLGLERAGDLRSANALVDEMIRVEPHSVRYHQKRVEYAVRANDRSLLAEAYYSLAENLFQMGEIEKSRAVYARVLELSPGDPRVRAALQAIDADAKDDAEGSEEPVEQGPTRVASADGTAAGSPAPPPAAHAVSQPAVIEDATAAPEVADAPTPPAPAPAPATAPSPNTPVDVAVVPRPRDPEPEAAASVADDFVNLSDWLSEDAPARNTRMVVDVKEPEIQEQVDFTEMLAMFKQGVAANVDEADHEAHYDLGVAYKEMGLLDEAISEFQKALRGTGNRARTYEALGHCFVERGQHQIAVTILSRALGDKSYTDDMLVGVLYLLGYASETLGRWSDAQRFYERVFAVDIEFRDIAKRLAVAERAGK